MDQTKSDYVAYSHQTKCTITCICSILGTCRQCLTQDTHTAASRSDKTSLQTCSADTCTVEWPQRAAPGLGREYDINSYIVEIGGRKEYNINSYIVEIGGRREYNINSYIVEIGGRKGT